MILKLIYQYQWNIPRTEAFFQGYGLQIVMGCLYLGGFVGTKEAQYPCLGVKVEFWRDLVATLARVACCHLQTTYVGLQKSLQQKCAFLQRVTPGIGMDFQVVEDALQETFLPDFFQGDT